MSYCGHELPPIEKPPPWMNTKTGSFCCLVILAGMVMLRLSPSNSDDLNPGVVRLFWMNPNSSSQPIGGLITEGLLDIS